MSRGAVSAREQARQADGTFREQGHGRAAVNLRELPDSAAGAIGTYTSSVGEKYPVIALEHDPSLPAGRVLIGLPDRRIHDVARENVKLAPSPSECLADIEPGQEETLDSRVVPALRGATMHVVRDHHGRIGGRIRRSSRISSSQARGLPAWAMAAYGAWAGGTAHTSGGCLHVESRQVDLTGLDPAQTRLEITATDPGGDLRAATLGQALRYASTTTREALNVSREARAAAIFEAIVRYPVRRTQQDVDSSNEHAALNAVAATVQRTMPTIERVARANPELPALRDDLMRAVAWRHVGAQRPGFLSRDPKTGRPYGFSEFPEVVEAIDMEHVGRTRAFTAVQFRDEPAAAHTQA